MGNDFNRGTDLGAKILESSLRRLGCCRSVVVDRDGEVLVGAKVLSKCRELGIPIIEVESDGSSLVVVRRTDVCAGSTKGREISFVDNLSSERGLDWDGDKIMCAMSSDVSFDPRQWGGQDCLVGGLDLNDLLRDDVVVKSRKRGADSVVSFVEPSLFEGL